VFNESVKYFVKHGSRVHCAALDASKAFDKVLHHGLFYKMLCKRVPAMLVNILIYWYSHLHCTVPWKSVLGENFSVNAELNKAVSYHLTCSVCVLMM